MSRIFDFTRLVSACIFSLEKSHLRVRGLLLLGLFLCEAPCQLLAQQDSGWLNQVELEVGLSYRAIGFSKSDPVWLSNKMEATSAQLGFTFPVSSNSALVGQFELQKQFNIRAMQLDDDYLVKPFLGFGIRHHFMGSGLWIQAMLVATYSKFYSGASSSGYRLEYGYYSYTDYQYMDKYSVTTFSSLTGFQNFFQFSLGYQFQPFKQSGLGFGIGIHSSLGNNLMDFDVVKNGIRGDMEKYQRRETVNISQNSIGFSVSFFAPLREFRAN